MAMPSATKPIMSDEKKAKLISDSKCGTDLNFNLTKIGGLTFKGRFYSSKELVALVTVIAWKNERWSGEIELPGGRVHEEEGSDFNIPEEYYHDKEFERHFVTGEEIASAAFAPTNIIPPTCGLRYRVIELLGLLGTTNTLELRTAPSTP